MLYSPVPAPTQGDSLHRRGNKASPHLLRLQWCDWGHSTCAHLLIHLHHSSSVLSRATLLRASKSSTTRNIAPNIQETFPSRTSYGTFLFTIRSRTTTSGFAFAVTCRGGALRHGSERREVAPPRAAVAGWSRRVTRGPGGGAEEGRNRGLEAPRDTQMETWQSCPPRALARVGSEATSAKPCEVASQGSGKQQLKLA